MTEVPDGNSSTASLTALCENCGTWHHLMLVSAPTKEGLVATRPACWVCGHRPLALIRPAQ